VRGFAPLFRKELREMRRTARLWVLPGIMLFFALTAPLLAKLTPILLNSGALAEEGVVIQVADPTYLDAYRSFSQNLTQLMIMAVIIAAGGLVSGEVRKGTAALVLAKPVSRAAFVLAKGASQALLVLVTALVGAAGSWAATYLAFGEAPVAALVAGVGLWTVMALLFSAAMLVISAGVASQPGAAGIGLGAYAILAVLSLWSAAKRFTPAGLFDAVYAALAGESASLLWPALTGLVGAGLLLMGAVAVFRTREI